MIVGGNIDHYTRVMTTAISLETRMKFRIRYGIRFSFNINNNNYLLSIYLLNNRSIK